MKVTIVKTEREFDEAGAWRIIGQILQKKDSLIGLSTGQTMTKLYGVISDLYGAHPFDASAVTLFNVDELTNLPRSYAGSCYAMIRSQLCDNLGIPDERFLMPPTICDDFERECREFEAQLLERGPVDLQVLGIGWNGHIGINQPGTPFGSDTWVSPMDDVFEERVRRETGVAADHELGGLTLGIRTIMRSSRVLLMAKGESKADIIRQALEGPVTEAIPASVLQLHPDCEVILDEAAASRLRGKERY